ncbi:MAG: hypothetical protein K2G05_06185, partial [Duncaniella sp.]|nr:hypothetical protein [Duncaniella sp.]
MAFLKFDLEKTLNQGDWTPVTIEEQQCVQKRVRLEPVELDMFSTLDITKFPDGSVWLDFLSEKYAPTKSAMDFMAYCTQLWGVDSKGRGNPSNQDVIDLRNGTFGRTWPNVKIVQIKRPECPMLSVALRIIIDNPDMSSFISNLAKGFVRSAVNQVGRDGGRVISNNIYNGQNYVPVDNPQQPSQPTRNEAYAQIPKDAIYESPSFSSGKYIFLVLLSLLCFPLGTIGVFVYGLVRYNKTDTKVSWEEMHHQYTVDRRYKSGQRYVGIQTITHSSTVPADEFALSEYKKSGKMLMIISGV